MIVSTTESIKNHFGTIQCGLFDFLYLLFIESTGRINGKEVKDDDEKVTKK